MAILASSQNGNFTSASTWSVVDNTSYLNSEAGSQVVTNTYINSSGFTPGAITIDGIGVRLLQTQTIPVGTFSVRLSQGAVGVAGTEVTINVSDIPNGTNSIVGWVFFKFAAPVTLTAATIYSVSLRSSTNSQVTAYRSSTTNDFSRFLRTTTTQAPVAADTLIVCGDYTDVGIKSLTTVTMDNTANITFGALDIAASGVFSYATTASSNFLFKTNQIARVTGAGTLEMGTLSSPIPVSSTATFNFVNTTNVDVGLEVKGKSNFTTYGAVKTGRAYLNADIASLATSLTTDISTNWLSGDTIAIASTTTTVNQTEAATLSADATGTSVPISTISFAHSGTNPTKAELINLTRNVKISGTSISLQTYINIASFPVVNINYTEFQFMGSAIANKRGVDIATLGSGSCIINGCAFKQFEVTSSVGIVLGTSVANTIIQDCVFYRISTQAVNFSSSALASVSVINCWAFTNFLAGNSLFSYSSPLPTFSGIVAVSAATGFGIIFSTNDIVSSVINNLTAHSNGAGGISFTANSQLSTPPVISNLTCWKNTTVNVRFNNCNNLYFDTIDVFSSSIANIDISSNVSTDLTLNNVTCNAGTSPTSADGLRIAASSDKIVITNSSFGVGSAHPIADINSIFVRGFLGLRLYNCVLNSATEVTGLNIASYNSYISSSKHDGVSGAFKTYTPLGIITKDYVIFDTAIPGLNASTRLTPTSIASKLISEKVVAVPAGKQLRLTTKVRTSVIGDGAVYNGALPQLVVKKNYSIGLTADTLLATATVASSGAFEIISGITPVATDDGAFTFCVTCDGTTGWCNVDSWSCEII